ncbi:hypothetical protein NIES21_08680 [Anabaenopsis circularis NIES-21]|uniref:Uncharacterized protein n=1 Tax=Anabaenopsis circularis NIES-21 TaxID=1085406 RepID=A0A1Z4GC25_9CYAN|nr:hypothetical protein NIES21_08680 [Anabaenopsis circularis NIES-21]
MTTTKIYLVVGIHNVTLLVFYTEADCWQFRLISSGGAVNGYAQTLLYARSRRESRA